MDFFSFYSQHYIIITSVPEYFIAGFAFTEFYYFIVQKLIVRSRLTPVQIKLYSYNWNIQGPWCF